MPEETNQLFLMLGRLESKVDNVLAKQTEANKNHEDLENRVNTLETKVMKGENIFSSVKAMWIVAAGVVGAFSDNILHFVMSKL